MNFKIDTKEKFHVISLKDLEFTANMTGKLHDLLIEVTQNDVKHIILNLKNVQLIDPAAADFLFAEQQKFYENNCSFVVCEMQPAVKEALKDKEWFELLNTTPTESEAWDIVQMEEVERELLGDGEN